MNTKCIFGVRDWFEIQGYEVPVEHTAYCYSQSYYGFVATYYYNF